ncbi:blood vessel epicardial substance-like [Tropilaelaps mercedesae]|uniref:Blood vessel epicardial substance-like n=1 Tax=Tropilaelaps mercedesae TaxID=418985 RepID=A0A1V9XEX1_9ACAR|nr:blood vessel epicardial substance-like [Tropilaelaps mercedesae]
MPEFPAGLWENLPCQEGWLPTNHILFHSANVCLFLSYCCPPGLEGLLYLRVVLFFGCLFFSLWGWMVLCAMDTFVWNAMFTVINAVQTYLAYQMLPRKICFPPAIEHLFATLFLPLKVSKEEFEVVYNAAREAIYFKQGEQYDLTYMADAVCLVLRGRIAVVNDAKPVNEYGQFQFIRPSQYFAASSPAAAGPHRGATLCSVDSEPIVLLWRRDELRSVLDRDPHLRLVFDSLVSRQILQKIAKLSPNLPMYSMVEDTNERGDLVVPCTSADRV